MYLPYHVRSVGDAFTEDSPSLKMVVTICIAEMVVSLEEGPLRRQRTGRSLKILCSQFSCNHITHASSESETLGAPFLISSSNVQIKSANVLFANDHKRFKTIMLRLHSSESSPYAYIGFDASLKREGYREFAIDVILVPMRCYFDDSVAAYFDHILYSCRRASSEFSVSSLESSMSSEITNIRMRPVRLKVDYVYDNINVHKLRQGDKHQLLSIFPLRGLQIDFPQVHVEGLPFQYAVKNIITHWKLHLDGLPMFKFIGTTVQLKGIANVMYSLKHVMLAATSTPQGISTIKKTHRKLSAFIITCVGETLGVGHAVSSKMSEILRSSLPERYSAIKPTRHERISAYMQQAYSLFQVELRRTVDVLQVTSADEGEALEMQFKLMFGRLTELILRPVADIAEFILSCGNSIYRR